LTLSAAAQNLFGTLKHPSASDNQPWLQIAQNLPSSHAAFQHRVSQLACIVRFRESFHPICCPQIVRKTRSA
jgi:hypothetical protein